MGYELTDTNYPHLLDPLDLGFTTLKTVASRINRLPNILWMKTSQIARYWMAREMVSLEATEDGCRIASPIACESFTVRLSPARPGKWQLNGAPLREVGSARSLKSASWAADGEDIVVAFDLAPGETTLTQAS